MSKIYLGLNDSEKYLKITDVSDGIRPDVEKVVTRECDPFTPEAVACSLKKFYEGMSYKVEVDF